MKGVFGEVLDLCLVWGSLSGHFRVWNMTSEVVQFGNPRFHDCCM